MTVKVTASGSVSINETVFPIVGVLLEDGKLILVAQAEGPNPGYWGGETDVELFGWDGSACGSLRMDIPAWSPTTIGTVTVHLPLRFTELTAERQA
jgi:hypothetical protein